MQAAHAAQYQKNNPIQTWVEDHIDISPKIYRLPTNTLKDDHHH